MQRVASRTNGSSSPAEWFDARYFPCGDQLVEETYNPPKVLYLKDISPHAIAPPKAERHHSTKVCSCAGSISARSESCDPGRVRFFVCLSARTLETKSPPRRRALLRYKTAT